MDEKKPSEEKKLKLQFYTTDPVWDTVLRYKIDRDLKNNNDAVEELIRKGITPSQSLKEMISEDEIPADILAEIQDFRKSISTFEKKNFLPLSVFLDKRSGAFYTECHMLAEDFIKLSDPDTVIDQTVILDPDLQEDLRSNRELEPDDYYFLQMVDDAKGGRAFSDIVVEFNKKYKEEKPLKILGGQHRNEAIRQAIKDKVNVLHGIKVYFNLNRDQIAEIMRIANTNINVSSDLRDRIQEERLNPSGMLRRFSHITGILKEGDNFGDKRRYEGDFSPSVRMVRSFIVNFYIGKDYKGDIDNDAEIPYLCKSGKDTDPQYLKYFNKFKIQDNFSDPELIKAGEAFAKLHDTQFKNAEKLIGPAKKEHKIKAFSLAIVSSWAYAAGMLHSNEIRLKKLYSLPFLCGGKDPLNAVAMTKAHHKTLDSESYRGLGARSNDDERGRLLSLFLAYSNTPKPEITLEMCNSAIIIFHSNQSRKVAEESRKKAF